MPQTTPAQTQPLVLALPKGRILKELLPLLKQAGIEPEASFHDPAARQLRFKTNHAGLEIVRVPSTWRPSWPSAPLISGLPATMC